MLKNTKQVNTVFSGNYVYLAAQKQAPGLNFNTIPPLSKTTLLNSKAMTILTQKEKKKFIKEINITICRYFIFDTVSNTSTDAC